MLPEFFLGWPSVEDPDRPSFLWFRIRPDQFQDLFQQVRDDNLPGAGVVYRYLVDNNKSPGEMVDLTSHTFIRREESDEWAAELKRTLRPDLYETAARRNRQASFLALTIIPAAEAFKANAAQVQGMETASYLLQSRLLIELLVRDHERIGKILGSAEQARVLAHEVGQVAQLLRVGKPSHGLVVWRGDDMHALLDNNMLSVNEREEVLRDSVFCPLGSAFEAAVNYIEIISDAKTAKTPFDDYFGKPLSQVLRQVSEFSKKACLAHWIRRQAYGITSKEAFFKARTLQSTYLAALARPDKFFIFERPFFKQYDVHLPGRDIKGIRTSDGAVTEIKNADKLTIWIAKIIAASVMNTLKYATDVEPECLSDILPVALIADVNQDFSELRVIVANRWPAVLQDHEPSVQGGTGLVLQILASHLTASGLTGVHYEFARASEITLTCEEAEHLRKENSDSVVFTVIGFGGVSAAVLLSQGQLLE